MLIYNLNSYKYFIKNPSNQNYILLNPYLCNKQVPFSSSNHAIEIAKFRDAMKNLNLKDLEFIISKEIHI